jgi:hypothetical protein
MFLRKLSFTVLLLAVTAGEACNKMPIVRQYKTKKVVLVSVDGARWSETWGDSLRQFIPYRSGILLQQGLVCTRFYNLGYTYTVAGHNAMLTGIYQPIENTGQETPEYPNIFQCWRWAKNMPAEKAWIISSKDKIAALANCNTPQWNGKYLPMTDCGISGLGSGYREDSVTFKKAEEVFTKYHPTLTLVHFREPDWSAHAGSWAGYLEGIKSTDRYLWQLWNFLQADPEYAGVTTMIVTNDHGRHNYGTPTDFISHGDTCDGCRHIELLVMGPDCPKRVETTEQYELIDIPATIAELLHFPLINCKGKIIKDAFITK